MRSKTHSTRSSKLGRKVQTVLNWIWPPVVLALAIGIIVVLPPLQMPALTRFAHGGGPIFAGTIFPFAFITIACGAISGFHALIASGTTPKLLARESDALLIGYGGMMMESFVAIMALIAACECTR